jgi:hypothetical protein
MKLGNYKWMVCGKCGLRYVQVVGGKQHKCRKPSLLRRFIDRIKTNRAEKEEERLNNIFNAGEDSRGNPIF